MGVKECVEHELLNNYPVLIEKTGEIVAHFKYTVLILANRILAITGLPLDVTHFKSENSLKDESILNLINVRIILI